MTPRTTPDYYDHAIAHFTQHPDELYAAWFRPFSELGGLLFCFVSPDRKGTHRGDDPDCGCLSTIKSCSGRAWTPELTAEIRADARIPSAAELAVRHLSVFAEWQRRLDQLWNRPTPVWDPPPR